MKTVSLIIPTFNKLPRLKLMLASVRSQDFPVDFFEVIIVNDGSTDGTDDFVKSLNEKFSLKYYKTSNNGRSYSRNVGIRNASGEIIIFVDDDVILSGNFIKSHVNAQNDKQCVCHGLIKNLPYLKFFEDPTLGIPYERAGIKSVSGVLKEKCITEYDIANNFEKMIKQSKVTPFEKAVRTLINFDDLAWFGFTGGNVSVPTSWMIDIDGFDVNYGTTWGCEDLDAGYRLYLQSKPFFYNKDACNYHIAHFRENFTEEHKFSVEYFYKKFKYDRIKVFQMFVNEEIGADEFIQQISKRK